MEKRKDLSATLNYPTLTTEKKNLILTPHLVSLNLKVLVPKLKILKDSMLLTLLLKDTNLNGKKSMKTNYPLPLMLQMKDSLNA